MGVDRLLIVVFGVRLADTRYDTAARYGPVGVVLMDDGRVPVNLTTNSGVDPEAMTAMVCWIEVQLAE